MKNEIRLVAILLSLIVGTASADSVTVEAERAYFFTNSFEKTGKYVISGQQVTSNLEIINGMVNASYTSDSGRTTTGYIPICALSLSREQPDVLVHMTKRGKIKDSVNRADLFINGVLCNPKGWLVGKASSEGYSDQFKIIGSKGSFYKIIFNDIEYFVLKALVVADESPTKKSAPASKEGRIVPNSTQKKEYL